MLTISSAQHEHASNQCDEQKKKSKSQGQDARPKSKRRGRDQEKKNQRQPTVKSETFNHTQLLINNLLDLAFLFYECFKY